jgi:sugar lactone lactonase YvrE
MAAPRVLLTDLVIGECARWHEDRLWFSHWGAQEILALDLAGRSEVMVRVPTTIPFSFAWQPDGRLLIVSGQEGLLLHQEGDGSLVTHADLTSLSRYPWNEIVVDGRGNAYVNSIGFDFLGGEKPAPGIIALVTPDGAVRQVADGIAFPNGMVITPDNSTLIVAESMGNKLTAYAIDDDGSLSHQRVWADLDGGADGICLDAEGAVWCPSGKRLIRVREGGAVLQTIDLDLNAFACALGGAGRRTLFMLAAEWHGIDHVTDGPRSGQVLTAQAPAPGAGWP